ncbi:threonine/serine dehydratase [Loktanella sp. D2R18]|uniref:threonine ammonia-lyase n=1 Tax=Rhodobacterales TaxID=204455 RepID=UPI000DEBED7D|nr:MULTISPECIES: pyridoxal-phosphate dependent enzyme [Rhodobacterales]MDO6589786.1 pyridoxal-phosphate dependent enzyme [Yoonia sp. 1_MG-2023]RBW44405.1 threonine/serine dehydratase [Loktanella sp. D2R18]
MSIPNLSAIDTAAKQLDGVLLKTPVLPLAAARWENVLPDCASVTVKLELFQQAGSFKARGAYLGILQLDADQRAAGVVAASGGNHALAVSWAAQAAGVDALICMPRAVDPSRIAGCETLGATVELYDTMADAFAAMNACADAGRTLMHPFEGAHMTLGAATCGAEYHRQAPQIDTYVVPIGGGGLISGMGCAIKQLNPSATVIGVEPFGADSMYQSFANGAPATLANIDTIADSLGAPYAMPYSYGVSAKYVDRIVRVADDEMRHAMNYYQRNLRITAEPACAASLAAVLGPLSGDLTGRHVGIIACGSNISLTRYAELMGALAQ